MLEPRVVHVWKQNGQAQSDRKTKTMGNLHKQRFKRSGRALRHLVVLLCTLPYSHSFEFNTLGAIKRIAYHCSHSDDVSPILNLLRRWRQRKLGELQYISIACAILLGAVIGSFSWNSTDDAYWLARAFWYISLLLSVLGILISAQQVAVLNFLGELPRDSKTTETQSIVDRYLPLLVYGSISSPNSDEGDTQFKPLNDCRPKKRMIFIWQCPMMFMSYSACSFLMGLTILVATPLIRIKKSGWNGDVVVAIIYLCTLGVTAPAFVFCAFWIYYHLDQDIDLSHQYDDSFALLRGLTNASTRLTSQHDDNKTDAVK